MLDHIPPESTDTTPSTAANVATEDPLNDKNHDVATLTEPYDQLLLRLTTRQATVGVIGLGYVGLPLAHTLHTAGMKVIGYDTDKDKVSKLRRGETYIHHIKPDIAKQLSNSSRFDSTSCFSDLHACDALIMCLPTPVGPHNEPDMSFVLETVRQIASMLHPGMLIVLESTTYPGATDTDILSVLNSSGLSIGDDYFLAFSPEREDPGNHSYTTSNIPKLLGGVDKRSAIAANTLYSNGGFKNTVVVSSARVAECAKLLENTYRAVNIALVNEMKQVFESMDVNIWEVLDAAETKPFGFHRFDPGPGIGGHCIPVDPFYLTWKAKETGAPCSFIELAATVNANMPEIVVGRVQAALNDDTKSVRKSRILLLGIAYKPNVDDIREAPALVIWERLLDLGADVVYFDPFVPVVCHTRKHMRLSQQHSISQEDVSELIQAGKMDAVVLVTHHDCFSLYNFLKGFCGPVVDTRNRVPQNLGLRIVRA